MATSLIYIRGTSKGIILTLDDESMFSDIFAELQSFLIKNHFNMKNDNAPITIKLVYRYIKESQKIERRKLLEDEYELQIEKLSSELTLKSQVIKKYQDTQIKTYSRVVRSGQTIQVEGSLLLIGDVNPGGKVEASGNIFIRSEERRVGKE